MSTVVGTRLKTCALCGGPLGRNLVVCDRCGYHRRPMLRVDATGRLAEDLPCQECGYNLRGHGEYDRCSECGTPVSLSVRRDLLKHADPAWLDRLGLGCRIMIFACIAIFAMDLALNVLALPVVRLKVEVFTTLMDGYPLLRAGLTLAVAAGGWVLTVPEPARPLPEKTASARRIARWCLAVVIAGTLLNVVGQGVVDVVVRYPRLLGTLVGTAAVLVYLRAIVLRIPYESLARQTRIVMWGYVPCQALGLLAGLLFTFILWPKFGASPIAMSSPWMTVYMVVSGVIGVGALAFGVLGLGVLIRSARAFRREAAAARAVRDDREV